MTKSAILIVDIQRDFTGANAKMPVHPAQAAQMIANLNQLVSHVDHSWAEVIYIGNEYSKWNPLNVFRHFAAIKGTEGTQLDERLRVVTDVYFSKSQGDAFSNPALNAYLQTAHVDKVFVSGLYAEACICATVKGALRNRYRVYVLKDCIATKSDAGRAKAVRQYERMGAKVVQSGELSGLLSPNAPSV